MTEEAASNCCVDGCEEQSAHVRAWTLSADGWGEVTVEGEFCCQHADNLDDHSLRPGEVLVELRIAGRERAHG